MRKYLFLMAVSLVCFQGCEYKVPASKPENISVDMTFCGKWNLIAEEGKESNESLLVLPFNTTEYLVEYKVGNDIFYFRAYPVKIEDMSLMQIELLGSNDGLPEDMDKYQVLQYTLKDTVLELRVLNSSLIDSDIESSIELKEKIIANKENTELFNEPGRFMKSGK